MNAPGGDLSRRGFRLGVGGATAGVAAFLLAQLHAWPPHEDETLALFIAGRPLREMLHVVLGERGGAPLHFLIVHVVSMISPSLTALRLVSVAFAVASIPVVSLLLARLSDRRTSLIATAIVAASWVTLFHGIYGRMYSLFLFLSALSLLLFLRALAGRGSAAWVLWGLAALATLASHQYGAFVLAIELAYGAALWWRDRFALRVPLLVVGAVLAVALPLWRSNLVLASRFDVGVGSGGRQLGGPLPVLEYLRSALGDFVAGWLFVFALVAFAAVCGLVVLARERPRSALLVGLVFLIPTVGLMLARVGGGASAPETRHLIFMLPLYALLVAVALVRASRAALERAPAALAIGVASLIAAEIAWGWQTTPTLYAGEPHKRRAAREAAETWLARDLRGSDVLFGYDPLFLGARERGGDVPSLVIPRADPKLALDSLLGAGEPLGRGVWVLDASDGSRIVNDFSRRLDIDDRSPGPGFLTRKFGPFLIVQTTAPVVTPDAFLEDTLVVERMGMDNLGVPSSPVNVGTAQAALEGLRVQETHTSARGEIGKSPS